MAFITIDDVISFSRTGCFYTIASPSYYILGNINHFLSCPVLSIAGKANLDKADLEPALKALKDRLMTKNVVCFLSLLSLHIFFISQVFLNSCSSGFVCLVFLILHCLLMWIFMLWHSG